MNNINENLFIGKNNLSPVIFIHGDFQNHTIFKNIENKLNNKGHTTLSFDLPGHGGSKCMDVRLSNFLEDYLKEKNLENPIIIGNSFGGMLALNYAFRTKNISGIILINSFLSSVKKLNSVGSIQEIYNQYKSLLQNSRQNLIDFNKINDLDEKEISKKALENSSMNALLNNAEVYMAFDPDEEISKLDVPILCIISNNEKLISKDYANENIKNFKRGKLIFVDGDHNIIFNSSEIENKIFDYIDLLKTL